MLKRIGLIVTVLILALLALNQILGSGFVSAQEKKQEGISPELKAKIEQLIKDLGAADWQKREAVEKALEEIGSPAEPFLRKALQNPDPEIKIRVKRVLQRIGIKRLKLELKELGKIAFMQGSIMGGKIWIMEADGRNQIQTEAFSPCVPSYWSPDGKKIAYHKHMEFEIYIMDAEGKNQKRLTNNEAAEGMLSWSPDSKKMVFMSDEDGNGEIYVMNVDGKNQIRLTNNKAEDSFPAWSPDGKKIAFMSNRDGNEEIYVMDPDRKNQVRLTNNKVMDSFPAWSPNGKKIAFVSERDGNEEIYIMDPDGKNQMNLTNNKASDSFLWSCWSPDGKKIAFFSDRDGNREIYIMDSAGKNPTRLTHIQKEMPKELGEIIFSHFSWSPDSKKIAFTSWEDGKIYVIDTNGKTQIKLTEEGCFNPAWQPTPKK